MFITVSQLYAQDSSTLELRDNVSSRAMQPVFDATRRVYCGGCMDLGNRPECRFSASLAALARTSMDPHLELHTPAPGFLLANERTESSFEQIPVMSVSRRVNTSWSETAF